MILYRLIPFQVAFACVLVTHVLSAEQVTLRPARLVQLPATVDSNSPAIWVNGRLVLYDSTGLGPIRSEGVNQFHLGQSHLVSAAISHVPYWIESAWTDADGTIFAWYHHEPLGVCGKVALTAPEIGALVSYDGGEHFFDLGIVLSSGDPVDCAAQNGYFAGGNGDFSVILGHNRKYFYFLFSNYSGPPSAQGIAVARMGVERRFSPVGAVDKYYDGGWRESGIGGRVTAIFPANAVWSRADADAFWGPSVHWNSSLNKFVMLLNHACCSPGWPQEGIYVSFNSVLSDPHGWTTPVKILDGVGWYPQVLGHGSGTTDKLAGKTPR